MQATTRAPARQRGGLIRRFRRRDDLVDVEELAPSAASAPPDIIDVRPVREAELETLSVRLDHLEAGVRMIVDAMKRAYGDLTVSIDALTRQLDVADTRTTVERIVAEEVAPLATTVRELTETVRRFPHTLAAAMDDMSLAIDTGRWKLERTLSEGLDAIQGAVTPSGSATPATEGASDDPVPALTPRPFELEPVELQFGGTPRSG